MSSKILILVVIAAIGVHTTASWVENIKVINDAVNSAEHVITSSVDKLKEVGNSVISETSKIINSDVQNVKEKSNNIAKDHEICKPKTLENVAYELRGNLTHCVTDKVQEGVDIANQTITQIRDTRAAIKHLRSEGGNQDCGDGFLAQACHLQKTARSAVQMATGPLEISKQATKAAHLITTLVPSVRGCAISTVAQTTVQTGKIIFSVNTCVATQNEEN